MSSLFKSQFQATFASNNQSGPAVSSMPAAKFRPPPLAAPTQPGGLQALSNVNTNLSPAAPGFKSAASFSSPTTPTTPVTPSSTTSRVSQEEIKPSDFDRLEMLGDGASSVVWLAKHTPSTTLVALKEISKTYIAQNPKKSDALRYEINLHRKLKHPHIVRLYSYFATKDNVTLVMEPCQESLIEALRVAPEGFFLPDVAATYLRHIASGLEFLHKNNIVHRDIKLENVLLDKKGNCKLADFGCATVMKQAADNFTGEMVEVGRSTVCGTLDYLAPEFFSDSPSTTSAGDVWGFGAVAFELLTGTPPFYKHSQQATVQAILHDEVKFPSHVGKDVADLIRCLLQKDPKRRPSMTQVLEHPFLQKKK